MEQSSPLAAMQPPSMLFGHCFEPEPSPVFPPFSGMSGFGAPSFFDLSFKKPAARPDFLKLNTTRGSSPTVSLAADLSQNFHIDHSPQFATPRRSLFTAKLFQDSCSDIPTPTPPSSSPAAHVDVMDMSPLPHKLPIGCRQAAADSPDFPSRQIHYVPSPLQDSPMAAQKPFGFPERKRAALLRPSLMRRNSGRRQRSLDQVPQFKLPLFTVPNQSTKPSTSSSLSFSEMFEDSSPSAEKPPKADTDGLMGPPLPRPQFAGSAGQPCGRRSPPGPIRRCSNPSVRPRKLSRRSISMFQHPHDVVKETGLEPALPVLQSITDADSQPSPRLPHFVPEDQSDSLPRISKSVLVDLIQGKYNDRYDNVVIIDCRFEYEYEGGHIEGAVNRNDKEALAEELFGGDTPKPNTVLVLHCEYSAHRAPIMAKYIRHKDRTVNINEYPKLSYPEMYILDGGYSSFFSEHRTFCFPQNYVEMAAKEHAFACERGLGKVKQRSKLSRAQTFTFGQQSPEMEDSPTGRCRYTSKKNLSLDIQFERGKAQSRLPGRRMFSH